MAKQVYLRTRFGTFGVDWKRGTILGENEPWQVIDVVLNNRPSVSIYIDLSGFFRDGHLPSGSKRQWFEFQGGSGISPQKAVRIVITDWRAADLEYMRLCKTVATVGKIRDGLAKAGCEDEGLHVVGPSLFEFLMTLFTSSVTETTGFIAQERGWHEGMRLQNMITTDGKPAAIYFDLSGIQRGE